MLFGTVDRHIYVLNSREKVGRVPTWFMENILPTSCYDSAISASITYAHPDQAASISVDH